MQTIPNASLRWSRLGWRMAAVSLGILGLVIVTWMLLPSPPSPGILLACFFGGIFSAVGVITGVVIGVTKKYEARTIGALQGGSGVLAHWSYTSEEWDAFAGKEVDQTKKLLPWIFLFIMGPTLVIILWEFRGHMHPSIYGVLLFGGAFLGLTLYLPALRAKAKRGDVIISRDGALVAEQWHSWTYLGGQLTDVTYDRVAPASILFQWLQPGAGPNGGPMGTSVRVPVPHGHEEEALQLVSTLKP